MNLVKIREYGKKKYSFGCVSKDKCSFHAVLPIRMAYCGGVHLMVMTFQNVVGWGSELYLMILQKVENHRKRHAELDLESNKNNYLRDHETSSG
jgi:hypothetical protein